MEINGIDARATPLTSFKEASVHEAKVLQAVSHGPLERVQTWALLEAKRTSQVGIVLIEIL